MYRGNWSGGLRVPSGVQGQSPPEDENNNYKLQEILSDAEHNKTVTTAN